MDEDVNEATHEPSTLQDSEVDIPQYQSTHAEPEEAIATHMAEPYTEHTSCVEYQIAQPHSGTSPSCMANFTLWLQRIVTPQPPDPGIARTRYEHSGFEVIKTRYDGIKNCFFATIRQPSINEPLAQLMNGVAYCAVGYVTSYPRDRRKFVLHKLNADENANPYSTRSDLTQQTEASGVGSYVLARQLMVADESCSTEALLTPFDTGIARTSTKYAQKCLHVIKRGYVSNGSKGHVALCQPPGKLMKGQVYFTPDYTVSQSHDDRKMEPPTRSTLILRTHFYLHCTTAQWSGRNYSLTSQAVYQTDLLQTQTHLNQIVCSPVSVTYQREIKRAL